MKCHCFPVHPLLWLFLFFLSTTALVQQTEDCEDGGASASQPLPTVLINEDTTCQNNGECSTHDKTKQDSILDVRASPDGGEKAAQEEEEKEDARVTKETEGTQPKDGSATNDSFDTYYTTDGPVTIKESPQNMEHCGLFLAESAIPNAGWGMYTGIPLKKGDIVQPTDLSVQISDQPAHVKKYRQATGKRLPKWLMKQYYWNARVVFSDWDAESIDAIVPSFGMLANSHTGLVNLDNKGALVQSVEDRRSKRAGAYTTYREVSFRVKEDLPAGHELFADYGDTWFAEREFIFGPIPLSKDYRRADELLQEFTRLCQRWGNISASDMCPALWQLIRHEVEPALPDRLVAALPENVTEVPRAIENGTAHFKTPNVVRSMDWLRERGLCLDHMVPGESLIKDAGMGAMAARFLPKDAVVAPAPLIHMHRDHLIMLLTDRHDHRSIFWQGHQLFLNYVYGHPSTSLVFFPYSPVTNFINHASPSSPNKKPNVKMQWSSHMKRKEWLHLTTDELLYQFDKYAGLMLEFVALRDIQEGEEILYDYGDAWDAAWRQFDFEGPDEDNDDYVEAETIRNMTKLPREGGLPGNVMTICWIDTDTITATEEKDVYIWSKTRTKYYDEADECTIVKRYGKRNEYDVDYRFDGKWITVKKLPRQALEIVDRPYTKHQYLRGAFRHAIQMPDEMIPAKWRDLENYTEECQLYVAESSIPNSGLGMFTATEILPQEPIFHSVPVIQVADYKFNLKLRHWAHGTDKEEEPDWLLENYFWNAHTTLGRFETDLTYSIVPGLGMLANSHTGLVNAEMRRPKMDAGGIHRSTHASAGSFTTFHDLEFLATDRIEAGAELFVEYGDSWFKDRVQELGLIPLSKDFKEADGLLKHFIKCVGGDVGSEMARDLWQLLWETSAAEGEDSRVRVALPRNLSHVPQVQVSGTAKYSVPNRVRSMDWLNENGLCLDNIKSGPSTIPEANRGAFATRPLKRGQLVAPAPVVHLHRRYLEIWDSEDYKNNNSKPWYEGDQLLLNYCFGHANSNVVLFPYSPVVNYINHHHTKFNAEVRWSTINTQRQDFKEMNPVELMTHDHAGLVMEIVATQDIGVNEEIFINYGDRWESAWTEFRKQWALDENEYEDYVPAFELNDYTVPVRTKKEQVEDPYPANVQIFCFIRTGEEPVDTKKKSGKNGKKKQEIPIYEWVYGYDMYEMTDDAVPCTILERQKSKRDEYNLKESVQPPIHFYTIQYTDSDGKKTMVRKVPRRAIEFFDKKYASDLSLPQAFRHEIELPDSMLPEAWNDRS